MYSYEGLLKKLNEKHMTRSDLTSRLGISSRTVAKIAKGEKLSRRTLEKVSDYFVCEPDEIYRVVSDNPILQMLRDEKDAKISGGLYHELQVRMTYNSNHMEGSRLSEDQTRMIFETDTVDAPKGVMVDDILETVHHFRAIDYVIDRAEEPLTENMIKHLHYILKHDTSDERLAWFAVGEYKKRANVACGKETVKPGNVAEKMAELFLSYEQKKAVDINDIISFHADFERIHPFQDGNGRVGRLIAFKECLRHSIIPFIIEDPKKDFYYRGLDEWGREEGYLTDTCLDGQDTFRKILQMFDIDC